MQGQTNLGSLWPPKSLDDIGDVKGRLLHNTETHQDWYFFKEEDLPISGAMGSRSYFIGMCLDEDRLEIFCVTDSPIWLRQPNRTMVLFSDD